MHVRYSDRTSYFCAWRFGSAMIFCSSTARAFISCLLGEISRWMYPIYLLHYLLLHSLSSFLSLPIVHLFFRPSDAPWPERYTAMPHPTEPNFLFGAYH
ncbi:hypothetical protein J3F83DRAFT_283539 [Trichoderma novae-zelandiae]